MDPEVLEYVEVPRPFPEADEVLIDVAAAGVQLLDARQRAGFYQRPEARLGDVGLPQITGSQVVGAVSEVGMSADASLLGQRVMGLLAKGGGYAQHAIAHPAFLMPIPGSADAFEMATLPGQGISAWSMLRAATELRPEDWFLRHHLHDEQACARARGTPVRRGPHNRQKPSASARHDSAASQAAQAHRVLEARKVKDVIALDPRSRGTATSSGRTSPRT